mmetsp:Transcript_91148/g.288772  ORF Transcript_91148/g.288772 Transcript_91148/m.288772 type:complete len:240 (-) Transcript_91148:55-774(-)
MHSRLHRSDGSGPVIRVPPALLAESGEPLAAAIQLAAHSAHVRLNPHDASLACRAPIFPPRARFLLQPPADGLSGFRRHRLHLLPGNLHNCGPRLLRTGLGYLRFDLREPLFDPGLQRRDRPELIAEELRRGVVAVLHPPQLPELGLELLEATNGPMEPLLLPVTFVPFLFEDKPQPPQLACPLRTAVRLQARARARGRAAPPRGRDRGASPARQPGSTEAPRHGGSCRRGRLVLGIVH